MNAETCQPAIWKYLRPSSPGPTHLHRKTADNNWVFIVMLCCRMAGCCCCCCGGGPASIECFGQHFWNVWQQVSIWFGAVSVLHLVAVRRNHRPPLWNDFFHGLWRRRRDSASLWLSVDWGIERRWTQRRNKWPIVGRRGGALLLASLRWRPTLNVVKQGRLHYVVRWAAIFRRTGGRRVICTNGLSSSAGHGSDSFILNGPRASPGRLSLFHAPAIMESPGLHQDKLTATTTRVQPRSRKMFLKKKKKSQKDTSIGRQLEKRFQKFFRWDSQSRWTDR